jgi:hypothetical protein
MEVSGQLHAPAAPQGKNPWYPLFRRLDGPQSRSGRGSEGKNFQPLPGLEHPINQPVAQRNTTELSWLLPNCRVKVKLSLYQAPRLEDVWVSRGTAPRILYFYTRWSGQLHAPVNGFHWNVLVISRNVTLASWQVRIHIKDERNTEWTHFKIKQRSTLPAVSCCSGSMARNWNITSLHSTPFISFLPHLREMSNTSIRAFITLWAVEWYRSESKYRFLPWGRLNHSS